MSGVWDVQKNILNQHEPNLAKLMVIKKLLLL